MSGYVAAALRRRVERRAGFACEYCLIHSDDTWVGCQVDHVISEKHGGDTIAANLALACAACNLAKGSDIASLVPGTQELVRLFNPRTDVWSVHFALRNHRIEPLTSIGEATVRILAFNTPERLLEREELTAAGRYPPGRN